MKNYSSNIKWILSLTLVLFTFAVMGQKVDIPEKGEFVILKLKDGSQFTGEIKGSDENTLFLASETVGEVNLPVDGIKKIKTIKKEAIRNGVYFFENPNETRNLYGPTGYGLDKGEGYYQNTWIVLHSVSYGFTDNFTMGAGLEILSPLLGEGIPAFVITPKFSFPIVENKINVGAGALYAGMPGEDFNLGIIYGVGTFGSRENNATLGLGYGLFNDEWTPAPIITVSGMTRLGRHFGFVTENWIVPEQTYEYYYSGPPDHEYVESKKGIQYHTVLSFGGRYIGEGVTVDLAVVVPLFDGIEVGLPWLGVTIPFGNH